MEDAPVGALEIICDTCRRSWRVDGGNSVYQQLTLTAQPCPYCEANTLSCRVTRADARNHAGPVSARITWPQSAGG